MRRKLQLVVSFIAVAFSLQAQFIQIGNKLVGANSTSDAKHGYTTDMTSSGNILAASAPFDNSQVGAVWVYSFNGINYSQLGNKLVGTGYSGGAQQGFSLSLTPDGKYLAVGGWFDNGGIGAVWIYQFNGVGYTQLGSKLVGTGIVGQAYFGTSLKFSADGSTLVIGGSKNNNYEGGTWIYTFNGTNFVQFGNKLSATGAVYGAEGPQIGRSVDISLDKKTIVVGAIWDNSRVGAAWVYTFNGTNYVQFGSKLVGTNAIQGSIGTNQGFCTKISADAKIILVSSHADNFSKGAFYVYSFNGSNYAQLGSKYVATNLSNEANFGVSFTLSNDSKKLAVGANLDNNGTGSVYIYTFNGQAFVSNEIKITSSELSNNSYFGSSVAFNQDASKLAVGAQGVSTNLGATFTFQQPIPINQDNSGSVDLKNGLVAYYPFNGNAKDESGNGLNGTIQSGITNIEDRFNTSSKALRFPGATGISNGVGVLVPSNIALNFSNSYSISMWFKYNGTSTGINNSWDLQHLISKGRDIDNSYGLYIRPSKSELHFYQTSSPGQGVGIQTTITSGFSQWNNVLAISDLSKKSLSIYFNGQLVATQTFSGFSIAISNTKELGIGLHRGDLGIRYPFNGDADEIKIYNRALNEAEIQALYTENQPVDLKNGLVAYYPFNGNANDESGNGNNGTVSGASLISDRLNKANSAYSFNSSSFDFIKIPALQSGKKDFTVSMWIKSGSLYQNGILIGVGNNAQSFPDGYTLQLASNQYCNTNSAMAISYQSVSCNVTNSVYMPTVNEWVHVLAVSNVSSNSTKLYFNGQLNGAGNADYFAPTGLPNYIGGLPSAYGFNGAIDDVKFYNRTLSEAEIQALYTENQPVDLKNGLVAYYPFNGNANDESGNGRNLTKIGFATNTGPNLGLDRFGKSNSSYNFGVHTGGFQTTVPALGSISVSFWFNVSVTSISAVYPCAFDFYNQSQLNSLQSAFAGFITVRPYVPNDVNYATVIVNGHQGSLQTTLSTANNSFAANIWCHFVTTYDQANKKIKIYKNGQLLAEENTAFDHNLISKFCIGTYHYYFNNTPEDFFTNGNANYFTGGLDDYRIYDRVLNDSEIQALYEDCESVPSPSIGITTNKLNTTSFTGFGYQWLLNESTIAGANTNILNDQLQIGVYKVKAKSGNCAATSLPFNIGSFPNPVTITNTTMVTVTVTVYQIVKVDENGNTITGVNQRSEAKDIEIYPNPNNGVFNIKADNISIGKIEIINSQGLKIYETSNKEINVNGLAVGLYQIKLYNAVNRLIETRKMVIE